MKSSDGQWNGFEEVTRCRPMLVAYCRRRGSRDPAAIADETIALAWEQKEKLDFRRCRPWLLTTARNLLFDEYRARRKSFPMDPGEIVQADPREEPDYEVETLDHQLGQALEALSVSDREAILLVAWEELTPAEAARSMGIRPATFRVRLHRARSRLKKALEEPETTPLEKPGLRVEENL